MKKICNVCGFENNTDDYLCQHCGSYIRIGNCQKYMIVGGLCAITSIIFQNSFLILLLPLALLFFIIAVVFAIIDVIKMHKIQKENNLSIFDVLSMPIKNKTSVNLNKNEQTLNKNGVYVCKTCGCIYPCELTSCPTCHASNAKAKEIKQVTIKKQRENSVVNYTVDISTSLNSKITQVSDDVDINELKLEEYRKKHQSEYLSQLKMDFFEEHNEEPNFDKQKQTIFVLGEDDFDWRNDYHEDEHQSEREYFLWLNKWAFFDYDDDIKKYKLIICNEKIFYKECYIDNISKKTKKLLRFIKKNPTKIEFYEADLKNQEKISKTGIEIRCNNCEYLYYSDNKKCPNCGYLTKDTIEEQQ